MERKEKNRAVLAKGGKTEICETEQREMWKKIPQQVVFPEESCGLTVCTVTVGQAKLVVSGSKQLFNQRSSSIHYQEYFGT